VPTFFFMLGADDHALAPNVSRGIPECEFMLAAAGVRKFRYLLDQA
jgi:hypothetical protein